MTLNDKLLDWYMKGFNDELEGKTTISSNIANDVAYSVGTIHALVGDDVRSVDYLSNEEILKEIKEAIFKRYELLSEDIKYQVGFIDDYYEFDFEHFNSTLEEMKELQKTIREL